MGTRQQLNLQLLYNDARLASVGAMLDELHTAASDGNLTTLSPLSPAEMVAWLRELIYTAEETIMEIEDHATEPAGLVRVK